MLASKRMVDFWKRHGIFTAVKLLGFALALFWALGKPPPPGYSVAFLALFAALMSAHNDMRPWQKGLWLLLLGAFLIVELRSINADRAMNEKTIAIARKEERDSLRDLLDKLKENLNSSERNLKNITGENSFAYISPQNSSAPNNIPLVMWNAGDYMLTGVNVVIYRTTKWPWRKFEENIGTIPPHRYREMQLHITPNMNGAPAPGDKNYFDSYWAFITAQNGLFSQTLEFRPSRTGVGWAYRYWEQRETCEDRPHDCVDGPHFTNPTDLKADKWSDEVQGPSKP